MSPILHAAWLAGYCAPIIHYIHWLYYWFDDYYTVCPTCWMLIILLLVTGFSMNGNRICPTNTTISNSNRLQFITQPMPVRSELADKFYNQPYLWPPTNLWRTHKVSFRLVDGLRTNERYCLNTWCFVEDTGRWCSWQSFRKSINWMKLPRTGCCYRCQNYLAHCATRCTQEPLKFY